MARWLVWQVADHAVVAEPGQARITFYSAEDRLSPSA
jgi:hypothetical protein